MQKHMYDVTSTIRIEAHIEPTCRLHEDGRDVQFAIILPHLSLRINNTTYHFFIFQGQIIFQIFRDRLIILSILRNILSFRRCTSPTGQSNGLCLTSEELRRATYLSRHCRYLYDSLSALDQLALIGREITKSTFPSIL